MATGNHIPVTSRRSALRWGLAAVLVFAFAVSGLAQNTKGDRPVNNQRQIRETKVKSYKRKEKARTKDIAGRRLRTKDKSSASRANASYTQTSPYANRRTSREDRAAAPRGRIFSSRPRERQRSWRGDIAGGKLRRIRPTNNDASKANVYPQFGPYVNNSAPKPHKETPTRFTRTATGKRIVRRRPRSTDHTWRQADMVSSGYQSVSGTSRNTFSSSGSYVHNPHRRPSKKDYPISNRRTLAEAASLSSQPSSGVQPASGIRSLVPSFMMRGRKNVYWGKFSRPEKAVLTDPAGNPVRTRNFQSAPAGLVGRDTLKFFGKKPIGDRGKTQASSGVRSATRQGQVPWRGDIAGNNLRRGRRSVFQMVGEMFFPRQLSASGGFRGGARNPRGSQQQTRTGKIISQTVALITGRSDKGLPGSRSGASWNNGSQPIPVRTGAKGMARAARYSGSSYFGKAFSPQGIGFAGSSKTRRPGRGGKSVSGQLWNNRGQSVNDFRVGSGSLAGATFSGKNRVGKGRRSKMKDFPVQSEGQGVMGQQGLNFSGNLAGRRKSKGGGSVSGKLWNNGNAPTTDFRVGDGSIQGATFQGRLRLNRRLGGGGTVSGRFWNNNGQPTTYFRAAGGQAAATYQGNSMGRPGFFQDGLSYTGSFRTGRKPRGGGSVSGKHWNNNGAPTTDFGLGRPSISAAVFQGNLKAKRRVGGGGSVSGRLWNNKGQSTSVFNAGDGTIRASRYTGNAIGFGGFSQQGAGFAGNMKTRRPRTGGGSVSGRLWNNRGQSTSQFNAGDGTIKASRYAGNVLGFGGFSQQGAGYSGNIKTRRPKTGGGSVSGRLWNNRGQSTSEFNAGDGTVKASKYTGNVLGFGGFSQQGAGYSGNIKTRRPKQGGGSVSGKIWNNNLSALAVANKGRNEEVGNFQGRLRRGRPWKGGGSVSGKLWNNEGKSIEGRKPTLYDAQMVRFTYKQRKPFLQQVYIQNPNAARLSTLKHRPGSSTWLVAGLQVKTRKPDYSNKPYAVAGSMKGKTPGRSSVKSAEYVHVMRRYWHYVHNPNSADEALDVVAPTKIVGRAGDYQGNFKMRKYTDRRFHPDAQFAHGFMDNVKGERTILTNVKLFWAKLFGKNDTQPENLKEKVRRPRYDKREQGLWYE